MFTQIRIVLVNPSHPGNIGAVARAMKNMGLARLYLVAPEAFPDPQASWRAAGADDVLAAAVVTQDLSAALAGCGRIYATSARDRCLEWPQYDARQCAREAIQIAAQTEVALVFGRESSGLTNEELGHCQAHVSIPTEEQFSSLNLAAAVQILAYELRMAWLEQAPLPVPPLTSALATHEELSGFYDHLQLTLVRVGFLNPSHPKKLMRRLRRLFSRAQPDSTEINILRGMLTEINKML